MKLEASLSPSEVLAQVAGALPSDVRGNVIIIGSLAAGYHFFAGDGARNERLTGTRRADEQHTARNPSAQPLELARILEEFDDLLQILLGFVDAGDESGAVRELADESRLERGDASASADADTSPASTSDGSCAGARVAAASPAIASPAGRGDVSVLQDGDTSGAESAATQGRRCMNGACARPMDGLRKDARYCSVGCRQAAWRFRSHVGRAQAAAVAKRIGIADPPYPGLADYYIDHPDYAGEVDHAELLARDGRYAEMWRLQQSGADEPAGAGEPVAIHGNQVA